MCKAPIHADPEAPALYTWGCMTESLWMLDVACSDAATPGPESSSEAGSLSRSIVGHARQWPEKTHQLKRKPLPLSLNQPPLPFQESTCLPATVFSTILPLIFIVEMFLGLTERSSLWSLRRKNEASFFCCPVQCYVPFFVFFFPLFLKKKKKGVIYHQ